MKSIQSESRPPERAPQADPFIPNRSEAPRLPFDFVIGKIGAEGAESAAYRTAFDFLSSLASSKDVSRFYSDRDRPDRKAVGDLISPLLPASARLGSGRTESENEASFIIRLVGKTASVSGELHLIRSASAWLVDELILEEPVENYGSDGASRFDPFTYTRFL
jgi:hypothetical protein